MATTKFVSSAIQRKSALARRAPGEIRRFPIDRVRPAADKKIPSAQIGGQGTTSKNDTATANTMTTPTSAGGASHLAATSGGRHSCATASSYPDGSPSAQ